MAGDLKWVALFAPPNCTGNSGVVGDTILQTSLVRTLLDRKWPLPLDRCVTPEQVTVRDASY